MLKDEQLQLASELLGKGDLVAIPTETVYGLAGNALSDSAVAKIYAAKERPTFNPLIVHVHSIEAAKKYGQWNERAQILAEKFWPGALTLLLPRTADSRLSLLVSAGLDSVALRIPDHTTARALLEKSNLPLAAPSANRSGRISPTLARHVEQELGDKVSMVLDGGPCIVGIESTIVDLTTTPATILRHGQITKEMLEKIIEIADYTGDQVKAPGMLTSHYAPDAKLRLNATEIREGEALLAFGTPLTGAEIVENLSAGENLEEAAANLFKMLRALDSKNPPSIAVMKIPAQGIGIAINDRLSRAATPL